jgi:AraC-like DNA-binding protein
MKNSGHLRIEEIKLLPGQEWIDDADAWRFCIVSKGAAYWLGTGPPRPVNEGEMIVLSPVLKAVVRASRLNEVSLHEFTFSPRLLSGFFTVAEQHSLQEKQLSARSQAQFLPASAELSQRFAAILDRRRSESAGLTQRVELLALAGAFFEAGDAFPRFTSAVLPSAQHRFEQLISQMPEIEILEQTPEDLARRCGCSSRHFNRLFRERFGESLRSRQTEMRLLQVRQMLLDTDKKVMEIALQSGYRSLSLFNALFKKRYGVSPSELRKQGGSLPRPPGSSRDFSQNTATSERRRERN